MDVGALANSLRRPGALQTGGGIERASLELKLVISLASAHGARADLLRELRALSGAHEHIRLVQPPGAQARLEAGTHRVPIPGALRDVLLAAVARGADVGSAVTPAAARLPVAAVSSSAVSQAMAKPLDTGSTPVLTASATALTAAAIALPRAAVDLPAALLMLLASDGPLPRSGRPAAAPAAMPLSLAGVLLDDATDMSAASGRLQSAVQHSELFAEARLARALQDSPRDSAAAALLRLPALPQPLDPAMAERTAAQLDVLRRDAVLFSLPAWSGQSAQLEIRRERVAGDGHSHGASGADGDAAAVFSATLRLDLPHLGPVAVMLRLANTTLAAILEANDSAALRAALPDLAAQLQARGLQPASLQARAPENVDAHAA